MRWINAVHYSLIKSGNAGFLIVNKHTDPSAAGFRKSTACHWNTFPMNQNEFNWLKILKTHMSQSKRQINRNKVCWSTYRSHSFFSFFHKWISTAATMCPLRPGIRPTDPRSSDSLAQYHRKYSDWSYVRRFANIANTFCSILRWPHFCHFV